jgi:hypothetical protein
MRPSVDRQFLSLEEFVIWIWTGNGGIILVMPVKIFVPAASDKF